MRRLLKKAIPFPLRQARFRLKRLGPAGYVRYRRLERAEGRKPPPQASRPFDIGGGAIVLHPSTLHSVRSHWVQYGHGIQELHAFKRLAPEHRLLFDIGAAEGIYSAAFCSLTGRGAWAFEPSPEMVGRLRSLCRLNPAFAIQVVNTALGASDGQRGVRQSADGQLSALGTSARDREVMAVMTLDRFVGKHRVAPDLVKIDVEGMELEVLQGGDRTFRDVVRTIVLEVHYGLFPQPEQWMRELQGLLQDYGFHLESLGGTPVADLVGFAEAHPELVPGYTIVVCRKKAHNT